MNQLNSETLEKKNGKHLNFLINKFVIIIQNEMSLTSKCVVHLNYYCKRVLDCLVKMLYISNLFRLLLNNNFSIVISVLN